MRVVTSSVTQQIVHNPECYIFEWRHAKTLVALLHTMGHQGTKELLKPVLDDLDFRLFDAISSRDGDWSFRMVDRLRSCNGGFFESRRLFSSIDEGGCAPMEPRLQFFFRKPAVLRSIHKLGGLIENNKIVAHELVARTYAPVNT